MAGAPRAGNFHINGLGDLLPDLIRCRTDQATAIAGCKLSAMYMRGVARPPMTQALTGMDVNTTQRLQQPVAGRLRWMHGTWKSAGLRGSPDEGS